MYSLVIAQDNAGKTVIDVLDGIRETDEFKSAMKYGFSETSCLVTLDEKFISCSDRPATVVAAGQQMVIYPSFAGG